MIELLFVVLCVVKVSMRLLFLEMHVNFLFR